MATPVRGPQPDASLAPTDDAAPELTESSADASAIDARPTREDIAREAYLIYLANGRIDGRAEDDWYEAEARLIQPSATRQSAADSQQAAAQLDAVDTRDRTPG
jgi:hypothetical protein